MLFHPTTTFIPPRVLAIGGSDSGGSAGIQADLKTLTARGVYGTSVLTIITAQNTMGVQQSFPLPIPFIQQQIRAVLDDIGTSAIKTGLLGRADVVQMVADEAQRNGQAMLVVDPVLVNGEGHLIVSAETVGAYLEILFPQATIVTPNLDEASRLVGMPPATCLDDFYGLARKLHALGRSKAVLIKGGHLNDTDHVVDLLFDGQSFTELSAPRLPVENPHGVGCTYASAIAAELARGFSIKSAVQTAHAYLHRALSGALNWQLGQGRSPVRHFVE